MASSDLTWATAEHLDAVLSLLEEYHRQEGLRRHTRERLRSLFEDLLNSPSRGRVLLAWSGGEIVGYALVVKRPSFEWAAEVAVIDEIFVRGKEREKGLGRRMIQFVEDLAASEGLPSITLEVSSDNVSAREFYRSVGFQRIDREIYARAVGGPR